MDVVRNFKFGLWINGSKFQPADDKSSLKGVSQDHVIHFRILHPDISLEQLKLEASKSVYLFAT